MSGYIYCLTNASIPDLVKIGKTAKDPESRAAQLGAATGVPTQFDVAWSLQVADADAAEADLHRALAKHRVNDRREFFGCTPKRALKTARGLRTFQAKKPAHSRPEGRLGLSLGVTTVAIILAACVFDLDPKTMVNGVAGISLLLTGIFWTAGVARMVRG